MSVVFKGGTSGNREDASPPVPSSGYKQPVQDTSTSGPESSTVNLNAYNFPPHASHRTADFMPTGGTEAQGTDLQDPTATMGGDQSIFVNTPYTGLKP